MILPHLHSGPDRARGDLLVAPGWRRFAAALAVWVFLLPLASPGALAPYTVDGNTLHLWHLDESAPPFVDSVSSGTNLTAITNGATLDNVSFPGFGAALSTVDGGQNGTAASDKDASISPRPLVSGSGDDTAMSLADSSSGAFTFEALVRIDFDPALNMAASFPGNGRGTAMQII